MATLQCLGATSRGTGSKHLQLPVEPASVDWVVLTHANAMERFVL